MAIAFDQNILNKIRNYGALKYSPQRIITLLNLTQEQGDDLLQEFDKPASMVSQYYQQGINIGDYNVDAELMKQSERGDILSIEKLAERQQKRQIDDLKKELFGI